jgi:hypothetical protein
MKFPFSKRPANGAPATSQAEESAAAKSADLAAEFRCLWTVSQFFSVLQRLQLQPERGRLADLTALGQSIDEIRAQRRPFAFSKLAAVQRDLMTAKGEIYELDKTIPVNIMRRFFERLGRFDRAALGEVVRYYLGKTVKSLEDRDKLDLLATRYSTYRVESTTSYPTWRSIDGLVEQFARLHPRPEEAPPTTRERTIEDLHDMRRVVLDISTFGDLIERKTVSRVRDFKTSLGELFYTPAILAEVVELNVSVHNKFQELYHSEMVRLQLEADRLARIQQDVSRLLPALDSHRALSELGAMTVQMQQLLQEVKKDVAERLIVDRDVRISVEEEGVPLRTLVDSCEEALRNTSEIVKSLHSAFQKAELRNTTGST